MVYESSYETGGKPFAPDVTRGYWAAPNDFVYACLGLAFKMDIFSSAWQLLVHMGFYAIIPYLMCLVLYVMPLFVIQCFMGQFSSSGFVSAFRVSPIFKGMGYISLVLNILILTYYSIFAAVPLLYLINSLKPTLPWSCEGLAGWSEELGEPEKINTCNVTFDFIPNSINVTTDDNTTVANSTQFFGYHVPSVLFFRSHFNGEELVYSHHENLIISKEMFGCSLAIWCLIAVIFYKCFNTERIGIFLRYAVWSALILLAINVLRFIFLPGSSKYIVDYFVPEHRDYMYALPCITVYAVAAFGAGWGSVISLASFNKFKRNIMRDSWLIGFGQMFVFMGFGFISCMVEHHFNSLVPKADLSAGYYVYVEHDWTIFLSVASAIDSMRFPNFWSILYYAMLTISALIIMTIQIHAILTSAFDEFEFLREHKERVTYGFLTFLVICSLYSCTSHGLVYFSAMSLDSLFTQTALNLLLLLVVLWIYGRVRFQRDIEFMLGQSFATWKVYMLRFVSPLFLLFSLLTTGFIAYFEHMFGTVIVQIAAIFFIILPWLFIPGYCIAALLRSTGTVLARFKRCSHPTDWYPVEMDDRQRYEEAMGNVDITHQLKEVHPE